MVDARRRGDGARTHRAQKKTITGRTSDTVYDVQTCFLFLSFLSPLFSFPADRRRASRRSLVCAAVTLFLHKSNRTRGSVGDRHGCLRLWVAFGDYFFLVSCVVNAVLFAFFRENPARPNLIPTRWDDKNQNGAGDEETQKRPKTQEDGVRSSAYVVPSPQTVSRKRPAESQASH